MTSACGPRPRDPATLDPHAAHDTGAFARCSRGMEERRAAPAAWRRGSTALQIDGEQHTGRRRGGLTGEGRRQGGNGEPHLRASLAGEGGATAARMSAGEEAVWHRRSFRGGAQSRRRMAELQHLGGDGRVTGRAAAGARSSRSATQRRTVQRGVRLGLDGVGGDGRRRGVMHAVGA
jgi:hypothetical protein